MLERRVVLSATIGNNIAVGDQLQNYRLAIAATAEYTNFFGGQAAAFAAIQTTVDSLNDIFEEEMSIHFDLVSDTRSVFTNTTTDGYTNGDLGQMISVNTGILDGVYTNAAYDIGHVFGTIGAGGSGLAGLGVVNSVSSKGRAGSTFANPQGASWINLVSHEIGHQFGAAHTFNANAFGSTTGSRSSSTAYEPASGSTIMSYAGIASDGSGNDNLQSSPDDYFHSASFEDIQDFIGGSGSPNSTTAIANNIPTVSGGTDYTIPAQTPFTLTAVGSDADAGDTLTYTWEQLDLGAAMSLPITDNGNSPLFRSFVPSPEPTRVFPRLTDLVNNVNTAAIGEALPTTTRDLNFRASVRDGNNGVNSDDVLISVVNTGTPFAVTSPNTALNWTGGSTQTITWNTGGTEANGINTANVAIDLSLDGGLTYPLPLESSTANDGSHTMTIPNIDAANARIRIRGVGNVFFDISNASFTITADTAAAGVSITETDGATIVSEDGTVGAAPSDQFDVALNTAPVGTVAVTVTADAQTEVSTDNVTFGSSAVLSFSSTAAQTVFVRGLDDTISEGIHSGTLTQTITSSSDANYPVNGLVNPVVVTIADDEIQPLVGVDFDQATGSSPTNWTRVSNAFDGTASDLIREDGLTTGIDLVYAVSSFAGVNASEPNETPFHSPNLDAINGNRTGSEFLSFTWTGLTPEKDYRLYVLTTEWFGSNFVQTVTVTGGAGNPESFTQDTTSIGPGLLVNSGLASANKPLGDDAIVAQADSNGEIRILVSDASVDGTGSALVSGLAIQEVGEVVGFTVAQTDGSTIVSEALGQDTFTVTLTSQPTDVVVINVESDDLGEATVSPASLNFDSTNWNIPQVVTVNGVDDALEDGAQISTTRLSVDAALTQDNRFDSVPDRLMTVVTQDNEALPLVGVDFGQGATPTNWTSVPEQFSSTDNDLINEEGDATSVDLTVSVSGGANSVPTSPPANLPDHPISLADIAGLKLASGSITLTWSDLSPGTEYNLWLFVAENFSNTVIQNVTITGAGTNPDPFLMDTTIVSNNALLVNSATASAANNLQADAVRATANSSGEIQIVVSNNGSSFAALNGAAIQEVAPEAPIDYGDAPSPYPTLVANNGASHIAVGPRLGPTRDAESDGLPSADADGDDADGTNDEDGVLFGSIGTNNTVAALNVAVENATGDAKVDAWIDFNRDGDWDDAGEQILNSVNVDQALQTINYNLPTGLTAGDNFARVRLSTSGGLAPTGAATDGEVEDYKVTIVPTAARVEVESVSINGGGADRSHLSSVEVTFTQIVTVPDSAFVLRNRDDNQVVPNVGFSSDNTSGKTVVTLTPNPGAYVLTRDNGVHSLVDGNYDLTVDSSLVHGTSGGPVPMEANYVFGDAEIESLYRYYADKDGDRDVDVNDLGSFGSTFRLGIGDAGWDPDFDYDGDDDVDVTDLAEFGTRFRNTLPWQ